MAWNAGPQEPPPTPHPAFWEHIHSLHPNYNYYPPAGYGVDHAAPPPPFPPGFGSNGFTFGPGGFEAWSGRHGFGSGWGRRGARGGGGGGGGGRPWRWGEWDGGWGGGWGGPGGPWWDGQAHHWRDGRRGQTSGDEEEDVYDEEEPSTADEEMRDAAATPATTATEKGDGEHDAEKEAGAGAGAGARAAAAPGTGGDAPDPPEEIPSAYYANNGRRGGGGGGGRGRGGFGGGGGGRGGRGGPGGPRGGGGRHHHHHHHHPHRRFGPGGPPPPPPLPFDFAAMMNTFADHPFAQRLRSYLANVQAAGGGPAAPSQARHGTAAGHAEGVVNDEDINKSGEGESGNNSGDGAAEDIDENMFVPPVDVFNTGATWTLHVALPGAQKEDIGVNWDAHRSSLSVSGVVRRPGDEAFLAGLVAGGERKVGFFARTVRLPPEGVVTPRPGDGIGGDDDEEKNNEIDADAITARMEDGLLIIVVPKVERDWTEVRRVDIE